MQFIKKGLIYLWDYFESLSLPSNRLMKLTSMLDLIILHKGERGKKKKKNTAESQVLAWVWEYWLYPPQESGKSPGMVALSLCRVASAQINILSVIVFPQEPQSLKSIYFFLWHFKMKYRSVSYISLLQFPKHFCTIFKVGVKVAFAKNKKNKKICKSQ